MALAEGDQDEGIVFARVQGAPLHPQYATDAFDRAAAAARVPHIRIHDLRHTAATILLAQRVPLEVVPERLGHSPTSITADVYQHVTEHMQNDAALKAGVVLVHARDYSLASRWQRASDAERPRRSGASDALCWSGWRDSNPRPSVPQTDALTKLRHSP